ncbi:MAG: type II toxin-antitoxin system RelE/ParE family toxin [Cyanobacteria bacterium P01_H01_bin.162]
MAEHPKVQVLFSAEFRTQLRRLAKRYQHIRHDLQPLVDQLQAGESPGNQIAGTGYTTCKVRLRNSDIQKGKSAGYRVIDQITGSQAVLLLLIY